MRDSEKYFNGDQQKIKLLRSYFKGDELGMKVWYDKYCARDKQGNPTETTPADTHRRMALKFAAQDKKNSFESKNWRNNEHRLSPYGRKLEGIYDKLSLYDLSMRFYYLFENFKYILPQGSVMAQLGTDTLGSLSNCVVEGQPHDSYAGIMYKDQQLAQLFKRRCGVGIDLSSLRPADAATNNAAKTSTGAVSFMSRFSNTTREVAQNGRRGALMISMDVRHPDIFDFVTIKRDLTQITGANISVKLNDEFMNAVINDEDYLLRFPCTAKVDNLNYDAFNYNETYDFGEGKLQFIRRIKARELWDATIKSARDVAEPGILNWDHAVDYSPDGVYKQYRQETTNPCSEIAMQEGDSCRLVLLNLFSFVDNPFTSKAKFNFKKFYEVNYEALRMNDTLVDLEANAIGRIIEKILSDVEPMHVKQIEIDTWQQLLNTGLATRRVGLGITGLGDALAALGLKYDSKEAISAVKKIFKTKLESDFNCSIDLAVLRGPFTGWDKELEFPGGEPNNPFYTMLKEEFPDIVKRMNKYGRRNLSVSTCAPAGSMSSLTQTSSGVEPVFLIMYTRRMKVNVGDTSSRVDFTDENGDNWQEIPVLHPKFKDWLDTRPVSEEDKTNPKALKAWFAMSPWYGATANELDWEKRIDIQAAIQRYITHSISSTINLPSDVTEEEVSKIYKRAWEKGLKGVTVYRDGARSGVLVAEGTPKLTKFNESHAPRRPKKVACKVIKFNNNKERWVAFVGLIDNKPYEVFTGKLGDMDLPSNVEIGHIVKTKDDEGLKQYDFVYDDGVIYGISKISSMDLWNYGKLISGMLRHGMPLVYAIDTIMSLTFVEDHINTWKNGVARALKAFIKDGKAIGIMCKNPDCTGDRTNVVFENGCSKCLDCGDSKCG